MTFDEYQNLAKETAVYPDQGKNVIYPTLGLLGEAGEVSGKMSKILRDDHGEISEEKREEFGKEMGDVLWFLAQLATELKLSFSEIALKNLEKLKSRKERGVLRGSGDER